MINLIYAKTTDDLIGIDNCLPWSKQKADMERFKKITSGHIVIMGRKTYESIGKPLINRLNIVITSKNKSELPNSDFIVTFKTLKDAIEWAEEKQQDFFKIFIIGGGQIYNEALNLDAKNEINIDCILETLIVTPKIDISKLSSVTYAPVLLEYWEVSSKELRIADEDNEFDYSFTSYVKSFM